MTIDLDAFIVELPSYMAALQVFRAYGAEMVGVPQDDEGMETDRLAAALAGLARQGRHPKFIYVVPDFQNPSGITWTEERRRALLQLATQYDTLVVEDNPYREIRFEGSAPPPIYALDGGPGGDHRAVRHGQAGDGSLQPLIYAGDRRGDAAAGHPLPPPTEYRRGLPAQARRDAACPAAGDAFGRHLDAARGRAVPLAAAAAGGGTGEGRVRHRLGIPRRRRRQAHDALELLLSVGG